MSASVQVPITQGKCDLFYTTLCPFARSIFLGLGEKKISCRFLEERPDKASPQFYALSPEGTFPVLVQKEVVVRGCIPIIEYLEESCPEPLLGLTISDRAEVRRLIVWFHQKLFYDVTNKLLVEKVLKRANSNGSPNSVIIKQAQLAIHDYLDYIGWLFDKRSWLAGPFLSWADCAAAAQLSVIDYLGDVPWSKHSSAKLWYMRAKSRPSFRRILMETFVGVAPSHHYRMLDF